MILNYIQHCCMFFNVTLGVKARIYFYLFFREKISKETKHQKTRSDSKGRRITKLSSLRLVHEPDQKVFYLNLDKNFRAELHYTILAHDHLNLSHVEVPEKYRNKGIATLLAKKVMDYLIRNKFEISCSCWFLSDSFLPAHPEYKQYVNEIS